MSDVIDCDVLILAGGFGTRLQSVVSDVPKPMAPVAGRPFLEHVLDRLAAQGARRVVLSVGYLAQTVQKHFGDAYGPLQIVYAVEQEPLGTGGAIAFALQHCQSDDTVVLNGDTYLGLDYPSFIAACRSGDVPVGIVVRQVEDTARYGRCDLADGRVKTFSEKGVEGPGAINAGVYYLRKSLFDVRPAPAQKFSFENDYLAVHLRELNPIGVSTNGYFIDIGVPEDYARAQTEMAAPAVAGGAG